MKGLPYGDMIASLVELVLHVAPPLIAQVAQHLAERLLIPVVVDSGLKGFEVSVADVERGAVYVAAVW